MKPLQVVHIISALPVGGVERNLLHVLPRLNGEQFRVTVVCTRERGELATDMERAGVPVALVRLRSRYDPGSLWQLRRHLRESQTDIVHCHMRRANTSGRIAAILAGVPVRLATEHDMVVDKSWRHHCVDRILAWFTDRIVGVTQGVVDVNHQCSGIPLDKFQVIYHGCRLDHLVSRPDRATARQHLGLPTHRPVIGYVGRLHAIKNVDQIMRALTTPQLTSAVLALVGDGEERESLERLAQELNVTERVHFTGFRDDLNAVYSALDAVVLASDSEGFGLVMLEALAAGVPLVSTPVGLAAEALRPGVEYVRVDAPQPELLAKGLAEALITDRAAELRAAGHEAVRRFSIDTQVRAFEVLYKECAAQHGIA